MCKRVIRACCYKEHLRDICRGMFRIRQYLSKKRKIIKNGIFFYSKVIHVHVCKKSGILICNFLVSCDSQVGPVSQTAIFQICSRWYSKEYLNCSCFATGAQKTLYNQKKKERTKRNNP